MKKLYKSQFTPNEEIFIKEFFKTGNSEKAFLLAYPEAVNYKDSFLKCQINNILKRKKIKNRLAELEKKKENALISSVSISKRKILETCLEMLEETRESGKAERGHAINLLKLLMQKEGLINNNQNQTQINLQVNNNTLVNDISKFLDL